MEIPPVKQVSWPQVVLALGLALIVMGGVVVLALTGQDVADVLTAVLSVGAVAAALLGVNLKHSVDQIKEISNGRLTEAQEEAKLARSETRELNSKLTALAMTLPPPPDQP